MLSEEYILASEDVKALRSVTSQSATSLLSRILTQTYAAQ